MRVDRIDGGGFYPEYPHEHSEIVGLVEDLKYSFNTILQQPWTTHDLRKMKEIAEKVIDHAVTLQGDSSALSVRYEILNRIHDKIQDFIIHPLEGLLNPGTTESSPKELWGAIESAFHGPWSLYQELNVLNSLNY